MTVSAASLLFLAACGNGAEEADGEVQATDGEITVWTWDPHFNVRALEIAEEYYQEENPDFSLNIIENAETDVRQRLSTVLSSGVEDSLPQIVFIQDTQAAGFLNAYEDSFYPVQEYINPDDFADYKVNVGTRGENIYSIPFDSGVTGLYVRTDYLEEAGYTPEDLVDITWEEYAAIGKDVTVATGVKWMTLDYNDLGIMNSMLHSSGLWVTEEDGVTPNIENNEGIKEAFQLFKDMA